MTGLSHSMIAAYRQTVYRVHGSVVLDKRIGHRSAATERLMRQNRVRTAAVLTAENPGSRQQAVLVNQIRMRRLDTALMAADLRWLASSAVDLQELWPTESGRFVLGITFVDCLSLAKRFDQNAFLWIVMGRPTRLVLCR